MIRMSDERDTGKRKYEGGRHQGEARSAPYPVGRLGAEVELVDLAREIDQADALLRISATSGLRAIAEQIRQLRRQARTILEETRRNQLLHRARCNFQRKPGKIYYLYLDANGDETRDDLGKGLAEVLEEGGDAGRTTAYFSMLSPADWRGRPPHQFHGAYRLENDMSWTAVEDLADREADNQAILRLLAEPRD